VGFYRCGYREILASLPYGPLHRLYRKQTYQQLGTKAAISKYDEVQDIAAGRFLWRLMRDMGDHLVQHLQT
jgi:hypothetical protein